MSYFTVSTALVESPRCATGWSSRIALIFLVTLALLGLPAIASAQVMCGIPGNDGKGNVGGVVNTNHAGSDSRTAGAT